MKTPSAKTQHPRTARRRTTTLLSTTMLVTGLVLVQFGAIPAAEAKTATGKAMVNTQRMTGPSLNTTQKGWYAKGKSLTLTCYARGQKVKGYYSPYIPGGWNDLWYKVSDGYWVADVDINTGSNNPVTGRCSTPAPSSSLSSRVDSFAKKWLGKKADYDQQYGAQCVDLFNYYNRDVVRASRPSVSYAYQLYNTYDHAKYSRISASSAPRKGDVAIWASNLPYSQGAGHVAIVLGTSGSSLVVLQQNYAGKQYVTKNNASKSYLRGYLRPKA